MSGVGVGIGTLMIGPLIRGTHLPCDSLQTWPEGHDCWADATGASNEKSGLSIMTNITMAATPEMTVLRGTERCLKRLLVFTYASQA